MNTRTLLVAVTVIAAAYGCGRDTSSLTEPGSTSPTGAPQLAVASNTWIKRADLLSNQQSSMAAATLTNSSGQSVVYVIGGVNATGGSYSKVVAYDAATNTWRKKAPLHAARYWTNGAALINGKIYVSGGKQANRIYVSSLYVYHPATDSWTQKRDMPAPGFRGVSGAINGKLYVLTYCEQEECFPPVRQAFFRYDPATDHWSTLPIPPGYHAMGFGGVIGGKLYVAGGISSKQLDVYDPITNKWTTKAPLGSPRWDGAGTVSSGKLYVLGGLRAGADETITLARATSVYDPTTNTWTNKARLPWARLDFAASRVVINGTARVEAVGGPAPGNNVQFIP